MLSDFSLFLGACSSKAVKVAVKEFVYLFVNFVVVVTYLLGSLSFFLCLGLSGCSMFISATNVDGVVTHESAITSEHIS